MSAELQHGPDGHFDEIDMYGRHDYRSYQDFITTARRPESPQEKAFLEAFRRYGEYETYPAASIKATYVRQARPLAFAAHRFISSTISVNLRRMKDLGKLPENAAPLSRPAIDDHIATYFSKFGHMRRNFLDERNFIQEHTSNLYTVEEIDGRRQKVSKVLGHPEVMLSLRLSELLRGTDCEIAAHGVDIYLTAVGQRLEETAGLGRLTLHSYDGGTPL